MSTKEPLPLVIEDLTVAYQRKPVIWDVAFEVQRDRWSVWWDPTEPVRVRCSRLAWICCLKRRVASACLVSRMLNRDIVWVMFPARKRRLGFSSLGARCGHDGFVSTNRLAATVRKRHLDAAREAMERVGLEDLENRQISQLSGGQQQRTFLARALFRMPICILWMNHLRRWMQRPRKRLSKSCAR